MSYLNLFALYETFENRYLSTVENVGILLELSIWGA